MTDRQPRYSATTHIGRVRKLNEDSIIALPEVFIWAVSDGMGGHSAGDFASQSVTEALATVSTALNPAEKMRAVRQSLQDANEAILDEASRRGGVTIGATVVVLILTETHFACLWVGDSRLYMLRDGHLEMLSRDHSIVAELVSSGQLTWDEAEHHPQSNSITRAVGVDRTLEVDKRRGEIARGDRFLLCSDGLNKYADSETIRYILRTEPIETVTEKLLTVALDGGGADNVSIIVVDIP